ncbi:EF hand family protein, putative [Eimeria tenella]|uniref:EF hand family protein, putative n=1 Tax=Eimeria tenella TaxID=5802 RepID=U6L0U1_EIMTE|nr:EF hand family protein, putative [Eimeria tenella]CDJ44002.1 EF hand family protein, putative [Eimeria tenella]|eukprot:XP_013234751.1 EF hand family protein, putative [Eimeria tenella]
MPLDRATAAYCARAISELKATREGSLSRTELKKLLQEILGASATDDLIFSLMAEIEQDCTGQIEFAEILRVFERQAAEVYDEDEVQDMSEQQQQQQQQQQQKQQQQQQHELLQLLWPLLS